MRNNSFFIDILSNSFTILIRAVSDFRALMLVEFKVEFFLMLTAALSERKGISLMYLNYPSSAKASGLRLSGRYRSHFASAPQWARD